MNYLCQTYSGGVHVKYPVAGLCCSEHNMNQFLRASLHSKLADVKRDTCQSPAHYCEFHLIKKKTLRMKGFRSAAVRLWLRSEVRDLLCGGDEGKASSTGTTAHVRKCKHLHELMEADSVTKKNKLQSGPTCFTQTQILKFNLDIYVRGWFKASLGGLFRFIVYFTFPIHMVKQAAAINTCTGPCDEYWLVMTKHQHISFWHKKPSRSLQFSFSRKSFMF